MTGADRWSTDPGTPRDITATVVNAVTRYLPVVDTSADLFEAGLTSILAMELLETLKVELAVTVSLRTFLEEPTIAGLLAAVESAKKDQPEHTKGAR